jgi:phospholipid/cholesterol/gamma-HCH transport system ATP-binding protein
MEPLLSVRNLVAGYGEKKILDGVSLDIRNGEIEVVLGTSGCGKSTLMRNILQLYRPWSGEVIFEGKDLVDLSEDEYNRIMLKIGVTFQGGALLKSITVGENVGIPLAQHTDLSTGERFVLVQRALKQVHLEGTENLMPSELSGGMQKRAALARAIVLSPRLVLCDEPTAGLDPVTIKSIDSLFLELRDKLNTAFLVVSHEVNSIKRIADSVIFLEKGKVLEAGPLSEVMKSSAEEIKNFFN